MKRLLIATAVAGATLLLTAACGGDDKKTDDKAVPAAATSAPASAAPAESAQPSGSAKPSGSAAAGKGVQFEKIAQLTGDLFTKDEMCPVGKWDSNSTGVPSKYRSAVANFKQFDCYKKKGDFMPSRGQQAIFVEFKAANAAKAYAQEEAKMYPVLLAGNTVVVAGTGLPNTDMKAYLQAVQETAGGAGEILAKA
ncbi:hypothetical protein Daura_12540 [Dactylosporangium aurantiacum]|uniref:Lipoprotein n=1 Tax=Dactylosporangium aurantiacum TaxID=35754 RepID=A0A9Q9MPT9_9ACTN|nr:hypothetical protein [Dactylosporangium aurantiacum]MDG6104056.1 hypothetical protein [Dactylosporangium aurantiacum]UWZ56922.1 hypothetical protein Daura_12540 [Dactylosporangium aurantiacum]